MVIAAFPAAKLGALLLRQISKPIANFVKHHAKNSPFFKKYVCLPPAQFYNWCEKKSKMWLLHLGQPVNIKVLNEADSIDLGANLLGEAVIFTVAAVILISEYNRGARNEAAKEEKRRAEMENIRKTLTELFIQTEEQGAHIRELTRKLGELDTNRKIYSSKPKIPTEDTTTPPTPPPPSSPRVNSPEFDNGTNTTGERDKLDLMQNYKYNPFKGIIFQALSQVENDFLNYPKSQRAPGIISEALNHLYRDVYRVSLTF